MRFFAILLVSCAALVSSDTTSEWNPSDSQCVSDEGDEVATLQTDKSKAKDGRQVIRPRIRRHSRRYSDRRYSETRLPIIQWTHCSLHNEGDLEEFFSTSLNLVGRNFNDGEVAAAFQVDHSTRECCIGTPSATAVLIAFDIGPMPDLLLSQTEAGANATKKDSAEVTVSLDQLRESGTTSHAMEVTSGNARQVLASAGQFYGNHLDGIWEVRIRGPRGYQITNSLWFDALVHECAARL